MDINNILSLIDKYISKYKSEKNPQYETIYRISSEEVSSMDKSFISDKKSKVYFCFYRLDSKEYDVNDGAQKFAQAFFLSDNSLKNEKVNLELNVIMPVRIEGENVLIDRSMMAEIISHELMHAYRNYKEILAGHYKWNYPVIDFLRGKIRNLKYTMTKRTNSYIRTMPSDNNKENDIVTKMQWVGYTFVEDEMFANLAGIKVFLAAGGDIKQSRGIKLSERIKKYIKDIEENATEEDWLRCMKKISYISARKNENVSRFRSRWLAYYKDRISRFDKEVEKLQKNMSSEKFKTGKEKLISNSNKEAIIQDVKTNSYR